VLTALGLPECSEQHLAELVTTLGGAYRAVAGRFDAGAELTVDDQGKLHVAALEAIPDPPGLIELRRLVGAMLPRVGLPEVILEVMAWLSGRGYEPVRRGGHADGGRRQEVRVVRVRSTDAVGGVSVELVDESGAPVAVVSAFLRHLGARGCSPNTVAAYAYDLRHLWCFFSAHGLDRREFGPPHALELLEALRATPSRRPAQRLGFDSRHPGGRAAGAAPRAGQPGTGGGLLVL
jgi:hypothetical protein